MKYGISLIFFLYASSIWGWSGSSHCQLLVSKSEVKKREALQKLEATLILGESLAFGGVFGQSLIIMGDEERQFWSKIKDTRVEFQKRLQEKKGPLIDLAREKGLSSPIGIFHLHVMEKLLGEMGGLLSWLLTEYQDGRSKLLKIKEEKKIHLDGKKFFWIKNYWKKESFSIQLQKRVEKDMKEYQSLVLHLNEKPFLSLWDRGLAELKEGQRTIRQRITCLQQDRLKRASLAKGGIRFQIENEGDEGVIPQGLF